MRLFLRNAAALTLGLLVVSLASAQEPAPLPAEDKDPPEVEELLKRLPPDAPKEQREHARKMIVQYLEQRKNHGQRPDFPMGGFPRMNYPGLDRLGADVALPSAALVEQLDLPKGQGLLLSEVRPGSAAAKAGLKTHDILLEVDGKVVPHDLKEFGQALSKIKEDVPVNVSVLRKGKTETIKGLALPRAVAEGPMRPDGFPMGGFPMGPMGGQFQPPHGFPPGGNGIMTTVFRTGDRFTARHQEGSLIITLVGENAKVKEIMIQDGRENGKHESVDKVPAAYRDKVQNLVEMVEKSNAKIEIKKP